MLRNDYSTWRCGTHELTLNRPRIMGILNVTPDSFSDGGEHVDTEAAIAHGKAMLDAGADIIDVGGESTRPGFEPVSPDEEAARVVPVVRALVEAGAIVSIDTRHAEVARLCVRLGASIVNDVTGFTDQAMIDLAATTDVGCVVVHAGIVPADMPHRRSVTLDTDARARATGEAPRDELATPEEAPEQPATPEDQLQAVMERTSRGIAHPTVRVSSGGRHFTTPDEGPLMRQVMGFLADRARTLMRAGVAQQRICVDPGPGFGKQPDEDVVVQRATAKMASMGYPLMCAVSRKRVVGALTGTQLEDRDPATFGMVLAAAEAGARILRVHDVAGTARALDGYWGVAHPLARRAFVALGSNVGDRVGYLARATRRIDAIPLTAVFATSRAYESEPAYGIATPVANCVIEIRTELSPLVLLDQLLAVEDQLDRVRDPATLGHGPRTIDCDLVWMEGETHAGRKLTLPHKGLHERDFVLVPMEDLQHNPARFLAHQGVEVVPEDQRLGRIIADLGEIPWQE